MSSIAAKGVSRWFLDGVIASFITVTLFLVMAYLITPRGAVPESVEENLSIEITRPKRDENSKRRERALPDRPKRERPPTPPNIQQSRPAISSSASAVSVFLPENNMGFDGGIPNADRRATPLVRIPPQYPESQLRKGREGWVLVEFTITPTGRTENVVVVDADPKRVFNNAVLRAIKRWKYQPKLVGGKAVAQHNMREVIRFELDGE